MDYTRKLNKNDYNIISIKKNHEYNISPQLRGGLGNNLFQIAAVYSFAYDNKLKIVVEDIIVPGIGHRATYQGKVESMIPIRISDIFPNINCVKGATYYWSTYICQETNLNKFVPMKDYVLIKYADKVKMIGTFMSHFYFNHNQEKIQDLFNFSPKIEQYIKNKYDKILSSDNTISVHIRRGDYISRIKKGDARFCLLDENYYKKAFDMFNKDMPFYVFFKEDDESKIWIEKQLVPFIKGTYIILENEAAPVDLCLMSKCKNNIIANSTFSFWGAYLNRNNNKQVVAPSAWKKESDDTTLKNRVLPSWTIIECECITTL